MHRSEYISERDFATIKRIGLNTVRIPVPYFIFGDRPPFIGCIQELDKAFSWAEKYDIQILLDLHTAPLSQNGFDNGGICDLMVAETMGCEQSLNGYIEYIQENYAKDMEEVQSYVPVICGEWCLFNSYVVGVDTKGGQSTLNGMDYAEAPDKLTEEAKKHLYAQLANAQLAAWQKGSGYFYWSYKLLLDTVNEPQWKGWDCWDLGKSVDLGWFPV